jgi:hypothetical protein
MPFIEKELSTEEEYRSKEEIQTFAHVILVTNSFVCTALQNIPWLYTAGKQELSLCIYIPKESDLNN